MSRRAVHLWPRPITEPISKDNEPASLQSYALNMSFPIEPFLYVFISSLSLCFPFVFPFLFFFPFACFAAILKYFEKQESPDASGGGCSPMPSHVHCMILPAIYSTSRTRRRTSSSTCGFRIIRNASFKPRGAIRPFRPHGTKKAA